METRNIIIGQREVGVTIRHLRRARRISLRMTPAADAVILTVPSRAKLEKALKFLEQKASWIEAHMEGAAPFQPLADGAVIALLGVPYTIRHCTGRGLIRIEEQALLVHGQAEFIARRISDFAKTLLQRYAEEKAREMAALVGRKVTVLRVAELRARWGSCMASGELTLNWRLVFAPLEVIDYVIAHEVAHLVEMNHSNRFWQQVENLHPSYAGERAWLRRQGHNLYRYR